MLPGSRVFLPNESLGFANRKLSCALIKFEYVQDFTDQRIDAKFRLIARCVRADES